MTYEKICDSDKVGVLRHFIRVESTKSKYADRREELMGWIRLSDMDFINKVQNFEKERDDVNPAILWTIGTEKDLPRPPKVRCWILAKINLGSLYTCGINSEINAHLDLLDVKGNLKSFVLGKYVHEHGEIRTDSFPADKELTTFIGVAHPTSGLDGEIEVLDGNHRAMAMLANKSEHAEAFIAELW